MKRTSFHRMMRVGAAALAIGLCAIGHGASAEDTVRSGIQIGALGALRTTLPEIQAKHGLKYDIKDFRDSKERMSPPPTDGVNHLSGMAADAM